MDIKILDKSAFIYQSEIVTHFFYLDFLLAKYLWRQEKYI